MSPSSSEKNKVLNFKEDLLPIGLLFFLVIIFLHNGLFPLNGHQVLSSQYTDGRTEFYPNQSFGFGELSNGVIPLWNPYVFSGMPYFATIKNAIFYPLNFLYLILPVGNAINWTMALHLFLSGLSMYCLLKHYGIGRFGATVAGIVYTYNAPHIMHIYPGHPNLLATTAWMPLMFLLLDRFIKGEGLRYGFLLSLAIALELFAGYPQHLLYIMMALSFYMIFIMVWLRIDGKGWGEIGSKVLAFAVFIMFGIALSAVQIMPTAEMTRYSTRENPSFEWVSIFSFPPENLITFLVPDFFGDMLKTPYWGKNYLWEMSAYVGMAPLLLAVIAVFYVRSRVVWFFLSLAVLSSIFALGKYTPILKLLYNYFPGFHQFRGHSKFIFLTALSLAVLSGFGADAMCKSFDALRRQVRIGIPFFSVTVIAGLLFMYAAFDDVWFRDAINTAVYSGDFFEPPAPVMGRGFEAIAAESFVKSIMWSIAFIISGATTLLLYSYGKLKEKAFMAALILIIILDLFTFGMRFMVTFDGRSVSWDRGVVNFLRQDKEPFRVVAPEMAVNSGTAAGIETLGGYDAIMVKRYSEFINFSQGLEPNAVNPWVTINKTNKLTDLLNAKYLVLPSMAQNDNPAFRSVFDNGRNRIYQNMKAFPRAFVVHAVEVITERDDIFRELMRSDFNPVNYAVIEEEPDVPLNRPAAQSPIPRFINYSANEVKIEAYLTEPGLLILGDVYYPGWKAYVDGVEKKIHPVNYVMRGLYLSAGEHIVEFRYEPLSFKIGAIISISALFLMIGFLVWDWRRSEASKNPV